MKVRVDKITGNIETFPTDLPFDGELAQPIATNQSMFVIGGDEGGLVTSTVQGVTKTDTGWTVTTRNSTYNVTILEN